MTKSVKLNFLLFSRLTGIMFNPAKPEGLECKLRVPGSSFVKFSLVPSDPKEDPFGHRHGLIAKVRFTKTVNSEIRSFVKNLNDGHFVPFGPNKITLPRTVNGRIVIQNDGKIDPSYTPPLNIYPKNARSVCEDVKDFLTQQLTRFLGLLSWRQNIEPKYSLATSSLYWGVSKKLYGTGSYLSDRTMRVGNSITWSDAKECEIRKIWSQNGLIQPLGHELLREAQTLAQFSPRSSILLAASALEVGVKTYCSSAVPGAAWLLENTQSPPIHKILRDYVPSLSKYNGEIEFWSELKGTIAKLGKFIEVRNKLAHTGTMPEDSESPETYIRLVSDVLYALDILDSHNWAVEFVSHDIQKKLGWNRQESKKVGFITTSIPF